MKHAIFICAIIGFVWFLSVPYVNAENSPYFIHFYHDRDEFELKQSLDMTFFKNTKFNLITNHSHFERYNATLNRIETNWSARWTIQQQINQLLAMRLKLGGNQTIDKRAKSNFTSSYHSVTTRRNISASIEYKTSPNFLINTEFGYNADEYDRPYENTTPLDRGLFWQNQVKFGKDWTNDLETEIFFSAQQNWQSIRKNSTYQLDGTVAVHWPMIPLNWDFKHAIQHYQYPTIGGIEKKSVSLLQYEFTHSRPITSTVDYALSASFSFSRADYDTIKSVTGSDRKDNDFKTIANDVYVNWDLSKRLKYTLNFRTSWQTKDYPLANINDLDIRQRFLKQSINYYPGKKDTLLIRHHIELTQHTYPDTNSRGDRDILNENISFSWHHRIMQSLRFTLDTGIFETKLVNLSRFSSSDNHRSTTYYLNPEIIYQNGETIIIQQGLHLNANYLIYDFSQPADLIQNDRLIRRFTYLSAIHLKLDKRFTIMLNYKFEPQDNGYYRFNPIYQERRYQINREQITDIVTFKIQYQWLPFLIFTPRYVYQETRLWDKKVTSKELIDQRKQNHYGLETTIRLKHMQLQGQAIRIFRWRQPDYWHAECSMNVNF